jgi:5'-nucleotidase
MKFLITNDDGYDGPGLAALYNALKPLGDVRVVAPAVCHSAKGHAVNTHAPLRIERRDVAPFGPIDILDSSPADCVRVGLRAPGAEMPDFVVAGINTGANLGVDLFYSGTAAAAREAAILGVPSLAISRYMRPEFPVIWETLSLHVTRIVEQLISHHHRLPAGQFWNVNFPAVADEAHPQEIAFAPQSLLSHDIGFNVGKKNDADGPNVTVLEYAGDFRSRGKTDNCDVAVLFQQKITATPIDLCTTANHPFVVKS